MSIRNLRTLIAIAEHGGFSAAAGAVGVSQSAVSLQMKALEDELGLRLFDRSGRYPELNDNGYRVLEQAKTVVALYEGLGDGLTGPSRKLSGALQVGVVHTVVTGRLPQALSKLKREHPELSVHVQSGKSDYFYAMVESGELNAAVITKPLQDMPDHLTWQPIAIEPFFVVAPHSAVGDDDVTLLESLPFIRFERTAWAGVLLDQELKRRNIKTQECMELDSLEGIWRMVGQGLGVSIIPHHPVMHYAHNVPVRSVPFGKPQFSRTVGLIQQRSHDKEAEIAALMTAFLD